MKTATSRWKVMAEWDTARTSNCVVRERPEEGREKANIGAMFRYLVGKIWKAQDVNRTRKNTFSAIW
jgi:hypothetical protein